MFDRTQKRLTMTKWSTNKSNPNTGDDNKFQAAYGPSSSLVLLAALTSSHMEYLYFHKLPLASGAFSMDWICSSMLLSNLDMHCLDFRSSCFRWAMTLASSGCRCWWVNSFFSYFSWSRWSRTCYFVPTFAIWWGTFGPGLMVPVRFFFNHSLYSSDHLGWNLFGTSSPNTLRVFHIWSVL